MITAQQLAMACDCTIMRAQNWQAPLNEAISTFAIDAPVRAADFLANVAHETARLVYVREIWGPTPTQRGYEGRRDLGNTQPGDGMRFMGRGLIQVTGRANYASARDRLRKLFPTCPDFVVEPTLLEAPRWAALSAGAFWVDKGLSALSDAGNFLALCIRINGRNKNGEPNGWADRQALRAKARRALGVA